MRYLVFEANFVMRQVFANQIGANRAQEIPIHPVRVLKALMAAHFRDPSEESEKALKTLESLGYPKMYFPKVLKFNPVKRYYPYCKGSRHDKPHEHLPRDRYTYSFEVVTTSGYLPDPEDQAARYFWELPPEVDAVALQKALHRLALRLWYFGTSSSHADCSVYLADRSPVPNWVPSTYGAQNFRVAWKGAFDTFHQDFLTTCKNGLDYPEHEHWTRYAPVSGEGFVGHPASRRIVAILKADQKTEFSAILAITEQLRSAFLAILGKKGDLPELFSGHAPDGGPSVLDHLAFFPLIETGPYQLGQIAGVALVMPKGSDPALDLTLLEACQQLDPISLGQYLKIRFTRVSDPKSKALSPTTWETPSQVWTSTTPVVIPFLSNGPVEKWVEKLCRQAGLPPLRSVEVSQKSFLAGIQHVLFKSGPSQQIPPYRVSGKKPSFHRFVRLVFEEPVEGPLGLGAGKHKGYGWFKSGGSNA